MPMKDANGVDIPGSFTEAEVKTQVDAAKAEATAAAATTKTELQAAATLIEDLKKQIDGLSDKDANLAGLRQKLEAAETGKAALEKRVDEIHTMVFSKTKDEQIQRLTGGDKALIDKVKINIGLLNMPETTPAEVLAKIEAAFKMSVDQITPDVMKAIRSSRPQGAAPDAGTGEPDVTLVEAGKHFGLSADDIKKYGGKK